MRKLHRWLNNIIPDPQTLRERRLLRMFGARVWHPALWHLNRRSVAGGVAAGLFCGLIPGPLQMPGAAIAAVVLPPLGDGDADEAAASTCSGRENRSVPTADR